LPVIFAIRQPICARTESGEIGGLAAKAKAGAGSDGGRLIFH
jgi:hypothetical protein